MSVEVLNKIFRWGFLILAGILIFSLALAQAVVVLMLIVWIYKIIKYRTSNLSNPFLIPLIIFIAVRLLSVFFSIDVSGSMQIIHKELVFYSLFFIVLDVFPVDDKKYLKKFFLVLFTAAACAAVYGTSKYLMGISHRAASSTSGYSTLGMFLTVSAVMFFILGRNLEIVKSKAVWLIGLILILTGILFTFNRTHWGITGVIILITGLVKERKIILILSALAVLIIAFVPSLTERFYQLIFFTKNVSDRDVLWQGASLIFTEHPLTGFGPKTFSRIFPLLDKLADKGISSWHSDFLQVYMESGIFALISFVWLAASIFINGVKAFKQKISDPFLREVTAAVLLGLSSFYLTAIVGGFIFDPISSLYYQLLLGILALIIKSNAELKNIPV